jgi:hypothetical protein
VSDTGRRAQADPAGLVSDTNRRHQSPSRANSVEEVTLRPQVLSAACTGRSED